MNMLRCLFLFTLCFDVILSIDGDQRDKTGCPIAFGGKCNCGKQNYKYWKFNTAQVYVVNCTNTNFKSTSMLEHLPPETEVLIFNGNQIPELDWNLFGIWDEHNNLEAIDLTNNRIREIPGKAFHKVKNVKRLVLDHNDLIISGNHLHPRLLSNFYNLESLHLTNAFTETVDSKWYLSDLKGILLASNMTKLKKLHLEQNEIWEIKDDDMFCDLPALTDLYLGDNQLKTIDFSLDCLKRIKYLDLEYNKIKRFDEKTLKTLDKIFAVDPEHRTLNLKGNPFHCDCHFKNVYDWLSLTNISMFHKGELRCYDGYPEENAGKQILNVRKFECAPLKAKTSTSSGAATTNSLLCLLIVLVSILLVVLIIFKRQRLSEGLKPLVEKFQTSMQYKTIEKEDIPTEVNV